MQVPVDMLLSKADSMFLEAKGKPRAFDRDGSPAEKTNELLENAAARVTVASTYVRLGGGNRSRPRPQRGNG